VAFFIDIALFILLQSKKMSFVFRRKMEQTWRTYIRVVGIHSNHLRLIIPGWRSNCVVRVSRNRIPEDVFGKLKPGKTYYAMVSMCAKKSKDLVFHSFEIVPQTEIHIGSGKSKVIIELGGK
jgi:hypothetical protein